MGILNKTKVYLCGPMQYDPKGKSWREQIKPQLEKMGIIWFDPYMKPYCEEFFVQEDETTKIKLNKYQENGQYEEIQKIMKPIRSFDLALCEKADFAIVYLNPNIFTVGTIEEMSVLNRSKRPIFCVFEGGIKKASWWLFGMIPFNYIYSSFNDVLYDLEKIDRGEKELDKRRWRLLKEQFR